MNEEGKIHDFFPRGIALFLFIYFQQMLLWLILSLQLGSRFDEETSQNVWLPWTGHRYNRPLEILSPIIHTFAVDFPMNQIEIFFSGKQVKFLLLKNNGQFEILSN